MRLSENERTVTTMAEYIEREATIADVAHVRHGWWIDKPLIKSFKRTNIPVVECSACGIYFCDIINNHYFMYHYCPNCGAKMDEVSE